MNQGAAFQVRQCTQDTCRFRFPAPAGDEEIGCPHCRAPTRRVAAAVAGPLTGRHASDEAFPAQPHMAALLDNVRSVFNVGAMLRTADGAGLAHVHLCGITATPRHPKVAKTALGAEQAVPWSYHRNAVDAARALSTEGWHLWALESVAGATPLFAVDPPPAGTPTVLVVGNERAGVDPGLLALCERALTIPMLGVKESLNVAIAFGIAAYHLRFGHQSK